MKKTKQPKNRYEIKLIVEDKYTGSFDSDNVLLEYTSQDLLNELRKQLNGMFLKVTQIDLKRIHE